MVIITAAASSVMPLICVCVVILSKGVMWAREVKEECMLKNLGVGIIVSGYIVMGCVSLVVSWDWIVHSEFSNFRVVS